MLACLHWCHCHNMQQTWEFELTRWCAIMYNHLPTAIQTYVHTIKRATSISHYNHSAASQQLNLTNSHRGVSAHADRDSTIEQLNASVLNLKAAISSFRQIISFDIIGIIPCLDSWAKSTKIEFSASVGALVWVSK